MEKQDPYNSSPFRPLSENEDLLNDLLEVDGLLKAYVPKKENIHFKAVGIYSLFISTQTGMVLIKEVNRIDCFYHVIVRAVLGIMSFIQEACNQGNVLFMPLHLLALTKLSLLPSTSYRQHTPCIVIRITCSLSLVSPTVSCYFFITDFLPMQNY